MKALELNQMEQIEGGIQVHPPFCRTDNIFTILLQFHPVVGAFCAGVAIGNLFYQKQTFR